MSYWPTKKRHSLATLTDIERGRLVGRDEMRRKINACLGISSWRWGANKKLKSLLEAGLQEDIQEIISGAEKDIEEVES